MKTTKRTIEFTVEKSEKFLVRQRTKIFARCDVCKCQVRMLSPEELSGKAGITARAVYLLIESDQIHFTETDDGRLLICLDSLSQKDWLK